MKIHNKQLTITNNNQNDIFDFEVINGDLVVLQDIDISLPGLKQIIGSLVMYDGANVMLNDLEIIHNDIFLYHNTEFRPLSQKTCLTVLNLINVKYINLHPNTIILTKDLNLLKYDEIKFWNKEYRILPNGELITFEDFKIFNKKYFNKLKNNENI